jgi:predicted nucleic acid-binding protein
MSVDFFDSNVFIYILDGSQPVKRDIARQLIDDAIAADSGCISFQVVQETLRVITGKLARRASEADAAKFMRHSLQPLWRVMPSAALYQKCLEVQARWKLSFYDSLIVAAALEVGCKRLLSEDLQHGQRIEGLRIVNPFR